jgi:hypothetical protein
MLEHARDEALAMHALRATTLGAQLCIHIYIYIYMCVCVCVYVCVPSVYMCMCHVQASRATQEQTAHIHTLAHLKLISHHTHTHTHTHTHLVGYFSVQILLDHVYEECHQQFACCYALLDFHTEVEGAVGACVCVRRDEECAYMLYV